MAHAKKFKKIVSKSGRTGFLMRSTVWSNNGEEILIGAPTIKQLERNWPAITQLPFDKDLVQTLVLVKPRKG